MTYLNFVSFFGIFGLCFVAWIFSEDRRVIPWRVITWGIGLQLVLGFLVFQQPQTREGLQWFSNLLDGVFASADTGARFVFGRLLVPPTGQEPYVLLPTLPNGACPPGQVLLDSVSTATNATNYCTTNRLSYVFAFRALPAVIFFSGFMALLENLGIIQKIVEVFAKLFFWTMRLSGAESLSGAANIFVGIEAAIVVKPYLPKMTRSELCAILACCFGTAASSTLAIYTSFLRPVFPNILGHLVSASIIAIPACFVLSKILVPETEVPLTMGGIPKEDKSDRSEKAEEDGALENAGGETMKRMSPMDATIIGALDGLKMAASIAAILILIVGLVDLINQIFAWLATINDIFKVINLPNIQGALFYPLTLLTGVSLEDSWTASVIIGRRLLETAIPPYQALAQASKDGLISDRTVIIVSYALSGFAHLASVGIFVGGTIALIPSRRRDISDLGWKALFVGTLATLMISCIAGVFDDGSPSILGDKKAQPAPVASPSPSSSPQVSPSASPNSVPSGSPSLSPSRPPSPTASPRTPAALR